jgi:exosortase E/protease (VPEID-CTERM system)
VKGVSAPAEKSLSRGLLLRGGALLALLVSELLALTIRFDAPEQWWPRGLGEARELLRAALAFSASFLLVVSPRLKTIAWTLAEAAASHRWWPWLSLHLAALGVFSLSTARLFEGGGESMMWVAAWVVAAVAVPALWLLTLAPAPCWWALARHEQRALVVAAVAGGAAAASARVTHALWRPLGTATFWLVERLLGLVYSPIVSVPSTFTLGTPAFQVEIGSECSGYEGIALILLFLAIYLWLFRRALRFPHVLLLLPIGVLAIWLSNILRIALLIAIGTSVSPAVAVGGFHSQAGWLFFLSVSLGLMAASHRVRLFANRAVIAPDAARQWAGATEATALLIPALVLLASAMLTSAASSGFDRWYPLRVVVTAVALWRFRATYRKFNWRWTWQAAAIGVAVFVLWLALETPDAAAGAGVEAGLAQLSRGAAWLWLGFRVIGSTITVPLAEELAFRGYLTRKLVSPAFETVRLGHFTWLSFLVSSVAFGLLHGRWFAGTLAGMAYAVALYRRGQMAEAVYAHMTTNALIAAYVLRFGRWSMWS